MTRLERREHALRKLIRKQGKTSSVNQGKSGQGSYQLRADVPFEESEALPYTPPEMHHQISKSRNHHMNIMAFLSANQGDPAIAVWSIPCPLTISELVLPL